MSDILVKQNKTQHVIFTGFRGSDKGWVCVSAIEEHQTSSSETSDTLTLWHRDFVTPDLSPCLSFTQSHRHTLSLSASSSHVKLASGTDLCVSKKETGKKNKSIIFSKNIPAQAHLYNLTRLEMHAQMAKFLTHCLIWSSLKAKKLQRRKDGIRPNKFSIFPFPGKRRTRKHCFQELLVARGPVVHVCTYTHTCSSPWCFENIHKCPE